MVKEIFRKSVSIWQNYSHKYNDTIWPAAHFFLHHLLCVWLWCGDFLVPHSVLCGKSCSSCVRVFLYVCQLPVSSLSRAWQISSAAWDWRSWTREVHAERRRRWVTSRLSVSNRATSHKVIELFLTTCQIFHRLSALLLVAKLL